jgi:hypothetical protein
MEDRGVAGIAAGAAIAAFVPGALLAQTQTPSQQPMPSHQMKAGAVS